MSEAHEHQNYVKIWYWLLVLLAISVAGPMLEIPAVTIITAFGIALVKSFLVAANFMHLKFERKIIWFLLIIKGGDKAIVFPVYLTITPFLKHSSNTSLPKVLFSLLLLSSIIR